MARNTEGDGLGAKNCAIARELRDLGMSEAEILSELGRAGSRDTGGVIDSWVSKGGPIRLTGGRTDDRGSVNFVMTHTADPISDERALALRNFIASGAVDEKSVGRLATTWGCSADDVRALFGRAAELVDADKMPIALAREEAISTYRRVRREAQDAHDWKTVLSSQQKIDALSGVVSKKTTKAEGLLTREEVGVLMRRILVAISRWPGAVEALRSVLRDSGQG